MKSFGLYPMDVGHTLIHVKFLVFLFYYFRILSLVFHSIMFSIAKRYNNNNTNNICKNISIQYHHYNKRWGINIFLKSNCKNSCQFSTTCIEIIIIIIIIKKNQYKYQHIIIIVIIVINSIRRRGRGYQDIYLWLLKSTSWS